MKPTILLAIGGASLLITASVSAAPNGPINAAVPEKGTGCTVRGSESQPYVFDASCAYHYVRRYDKDGNLIDLSYEDKGTLQPGQDLPAKAVRIIATGIVVAGMNCSGAEVITPAGNYSTSFSCK